MQPIENIYLTIRNIRIFWSTIRLTIMSILYIFIFIISSQTIRVFGADNLVLPRPPELEQAINFWVRVYTEIDTAHGFLHDAEDLSIIYDELISDNQIIDDRRKEIQADLLVLANGKRSDLTNNQELILNLWPGDVLNERLIRASENIRWQLGQSDRFVLGLQRSGRYREYINNIIITKSLPIALAGIPHVESSFNPSAFSSAAASGMWQFTRVTGQRFMRIDNIVDERLDPYISAEAAMNLLEYNYNVLGTWPLAITAYNHGVSGISRAVRETGTTDIQTIISDYKGRSFGFASRNFYVQLLAVNEVEKNAESYFGDINYESAPKYVEYYADSYINAEGFANDLSVSLEQIKNDNPALLSNVWDGSKLIPRGYRVKLRAEGLPESNNLISLINSNNKYSTQIQDINYIAEEGDNLSIIAEKFGVSVETLTMLNQLNAVNEIQAGQKILLPNNNELLSKNLDENINLPTLFGNVENFQTDNRLNFGVTNKINKESQNINTSSINITKEGEFIESKINESLIIDTTTENNISSNTNNEKTALSINIVSSMLNEINQDGLSDNIKINYSGSKDIGSSDDLLEALSSDPSDYTISMNDTIKIQASETLSHFSDWLDIRALDIRILNSMTYRDEVIIGSVLKLNFDKVTKNEFETKRKYYHSMMQQDFFKKYRIKGLYEYEVKTNDNITKIAINRYSAPLWLVTQYNNNIDFNRIRVGQNIIFPILELNKL